VARSPHSRPPPSIRGITEQDYITWRHHPVTLMVRRYMIDRRDATKQEIIDQVRGPGLSREQQVGLTTGSLVHHSIAMLDFAEIVGFYNNTKDASETREKDDFDAIPNELRNLPDVQDQEEEEDNAA